MTTALHAPAAAAPFFPACPTWCAETHNPGDELVTHFGIETLAPRVHQRSVSDGATTVTVTRVDHGSTCDGSFEVGDVQITVTAVA